MSQKHGSRKMTPKGWHSNTRSWSEPPALARARVSWLVSPKARGTFRLTWDRESERTPGRPKHSRTSERPRNSRELNWPKLKMSPPARSILICRKGRSPQRRCLNGSKSRMKPIWLERMRTQTITATQTLLRREPSRKEKHWGKRKLKRDERKALSIYGKAALL